MSNEISVDIFCKIIDNYGDAGVTYRLARNLNDLNCKVRLFTDIPLTMKKLVPELPVLNNEQNFDYTTKEGITIRNWPTEKDAFIPSKVVIEAFQCALPTHITSKITKSTVWINLDYLSAEKWVEDCHKMPSFQPNGNIKYFFFPGFSEKTGGLNFDREITTIAKEKAKAGVLELLSIPKEQRNEITKNFWLQIFSYETPALIDLIKAVTEVKKNVVLFLPEGRSRTYFEANTAFTELCENKKLKVIKFDMLEQQKYNLILKAMDLNVVRGEDSITQANMTGSPFLWHIYRQEENAHIDKLKAFLNVYTKDSTSEHLTETITKAFLALNTSPEELSGTFSTFYNFMIEYKAICGLSQKWAQLLLKNENLSTNLLNFIKEQVGSKD